MVQKKEINIQIGLEVKLARERAKLTQERFAEAIDVSPQYVSDLERGVVGVSLATLKKICQTLGVSSDRLLFGSSADTSAAAIAEKCRCLSPAQTVLLYEIIDCYTEAIRQERSQAASNPASE